ncbi:MAG: hypothetical protein IKI75_02535 [Lachnospiraceae bacterium]|nr:hypothetical protein [Lachnospiraceae bacterium]
MFDEREKKYSRILLTASWILIIAWRLYFLFRYSFNYVDEDSAITWIGTVHFAHGHLANPFYLGQDYNIMLDALLAAPLYLLGWPLNYALPFTTFILCLFPFVFCSVFAWRGGKRGAAFVPVLLMAAAGWKWDLFTSIPRTLISGFGVAVVGAVICNDTGAKTAKMFTGAFLCVLGAVMTLSAVTVSGLAFLGYFLSLPAEGEPAEKKKRTAALFGGIILGILVYAAGRVYFYLHPEEMLRSGSLEGMHFDTFLENLRNLPGILSDLFSGGAVIVPLILAGLTVLAIFCKRYRELVLLLAAAGGSMATLSFGWTEIYDRGGLMFGQVRIFLYVVFVALTVSALSESVLPEKWEKGFVCAALPVIILLIAYKAFAFNTELGREDTELLPPGAGITIMSVEALEKQADAMVQTAQEYGIDVLICIDYSRVFEHGASALYYDSPVVFYVPDRERRTWVWKEMNEKTGQDILFYTLPVSKDMQVTYVNTGDMTVPTYLEKELGITRGLDKIWGIRGGELE